MIPDMKMEMKWKTMEKIFFERFKICTPLPEPSLPALLPILLPPPILPILPPPLASHLPTLPPSTLLSHFHSIHGWTLPIQLEEQASKSGHMAWESGAETLWMLLYALLIMWRVAGQCCDTIPFCTVLVSRLHVNYNQSQGTPCGNTHAILSSSQISILDSWCCPCSPSPENRLSEARTQGTGTYTWRSMET